MATTAFKGSPVDTSGNLPAVGAAAPAFTLTGGDLGAVTSEGLTGGRVVLNVFLSVDTPVCAQSVRTFNERAAGLEDTTVVCVSADLPFAAGRFCGAEGIENVTTGSTFRNSEFLDDYGVGIVGGPLGGCAPEPWWLSTQTAPCCIPSWSRRSPPSPTTTQPSPRWADAAGRSAGSRRRNLSGHLPARSSPFPGSPCSEDAGDRAH